MADVDLTAIRADYDRYVAALEEWTGDKDFDRWNAEERAHRALIRMPALLALVDEQAARLDKSVSAPALFDALAERRTALVRLAAAEARIAELEAEGAVVRDEFRVIFRVGDWVPRIVYVGSEAAAMALVDRAATEEPDTVCEVVRVRTTRTRVWPPEGAGAEKPPEGPQDGLALSETRETALPPA